MKILDKQVSSDGSFKYLWDLGENNNSVESIFFYLRGEPQTCISSQVGCNVGCLFCETGKQRNIRNLTLQEIYDQVKLATVDISEAAEFIRFKSVIFAGMGEPLLNFEAFREASHKLLDDGLTENVTVTTSGIVPKIHQLHTVPITRLSVSLHGTTNEIRNQLVPINMKFPIEEVMSAAAEYHAKTGNPVTLNYLLFENLNDSDADLERLIDLVDSAVFEIKLKEWNPIPGVEIRNSSRFDYFEEQLKLHGYRVVVDHSKGADIAGGCGQLRSLHRDLKQRRH